MGKPTGFLEADRVGPPKRPKSERIGDWREIEQLASEEELVRQTARCMDCGIPYCHYFGCPLGNLIPDFNDAVYRGRWQRALRLLNRTIDFPEFTGRVCPAPCEGACTLMIDEKPVTICHTELQIIERGFREGWVLPEPPLRESGFKVAVVGSGPAGLAAAQNLRRRGHAVVVFEKDDRIGGILRYGIPDFKLEKWVIDRRLDLMRAEGVRFETKVEAGVDVSAAYLARTFDATVLTVGAGRARDIEAPGRRLDGIHFAMDFLTQQNKRNASESEAPPRFEREITAKGKRVVVIGGGDTGSDCIGTSRRQGATAITQIEILPKPPEKRAASNPWPTWPLTLRTSTSHEEGCERLWSVLTKEFVDNGSGGVGTLRCVRIAWSEPDASGRRSFEEVAGSEFEIEADLVLLAMGFVHAEHGPLVQGFGIECDPRGNLKVDSTGMTSARGVFAAGDCSRGASLVVHAMNLGRRVAAGVDAYLESIAKSEARRDAGGSI